MKVKSESEVTQLYPTLSNPTDCSLPSSSIIQYSGLQNSMDCIVHGIKKSQTRLSNFHFTSLLSHLEVTQVAGGDRKKQPCKGRDSFTHDVLGKGPQAFHRGATWVRG